MNDRWTHIRSRQDTLARFVFGRSMWKLTFSRVTVALPSVLALAIAAMIFVLDMRTPPEVAFAVLYVGVVLMAARFMGARGIALTAAGCACLTLLTYLSDRETLANATLSVIAIAATAFLSIRGRRVEDAVRLTETGWRDIFEHNPVMYFVLNSAGTVLSVNSLGAVELRYLADELVGQSVFQLFLDADRERVRANLNLCLESLGQSNTWEVQKVRKDGGTLWVRETATAIKRAKGGVVVLIAGEDITERRRAEESVRESAKRFRALIEHAYDAVLLLDSDNSVLYVSPSVERILGYSPEEMVGRDRFDLFHPDELPDAKEKFAAASRHPGSVYRAERLIRHKSGKWLWIENTVTNLLGEPSVHAFVVNLRDITQSKQAEDALRASEARFRTFVDYATDAFFLLDDHSTVVDANRQACESLGYSREELIGTHRKDFDASLDETAAQGSELRIASAESVIFESRHRRKDGTTFPVEVRVGEFEQGGRRYLYLVRDISQRKQAEEALRRYQARIRRMIEADIIGVFFWNFDGQILEANDAFLRIVRYEREDLLSGRLSWREMTPVEWVEPHEKQWLPELRRTGTVRPHEKEYFRKDGSRVPVLIGEATFEEGGDEGVAFVLDLTERQRAEEALRRSEAYLAQAQRLSHTGTSVFNTATTFYWSEECYQIWGLDPLQGVPDRETVWQRIHPDDRDRVSALALEALRKKREYVVDFRIVLPDGTLRHIASTGHPLLAADGERVEIVATHVDVTERVRAQEQAERLRQLESDLAHMNRLSMMGELTASLAHEILHPIATARNNARAGTRFLDMSPPDLGEVREALNCVVRDADRAKDIVARIRDHVKKAPPRMDRFDLNEAIDEVIVMARGPIVRNKVAVRAFLTAGLIFDSGRSRSTATSRPELDPERC